MEGLEIGGEGEDQEDLEEGEELGATKKPSKEVRLKDVYEPAVIAQRMLTEDDEIIRMTDIPERYQLDRKGFPFPDEAQLAREALFIARQLSLSGGTSDNKPLSYDNPVVKAVLAVLKFIRVEYLEIPFIAVHRKDYFLPHLSPSDLWKIYDLDEKFLTLEMKKKALRSSFEEIQRQSETAQSDDYAFEQIEKTASLEDVSDMQFYLQLHYGMSNQSMDNAKSRMFKKPLWRVTYEGALRNNIDEFAKVRFTA
jgi:transcription elongation factor SPT6